MLSTAPSASTANPAERILLGAGPSPVPQRVLRALAAPTLGHLDPQYLAILDETCEMLRQVFRTRNPLTFPLSSTGMAGMECLASNLIEPGDEAIVCVNGFFGARMKEVMERCGATVHAVEVPWGDTFSLEAIAAIFDQHPQAKLLGIVHAETSTGAHQPLAGLGELVHARGALLMVDTVTSLGVVTQKKNFAKSKSDREKFFWESVASRPMLEETLRKADRIRPFKDEGDYSYAMKQLCGDRFVMVGDAGRFVDPIFSTGVSIALNSSRFAHKDILAALEKNDFSRQSFSNFENTLRLGTKNWYDFITVYYRLNVLFTYFINDPRYRLDVLKLLQGDVYDDATPPVLEKMRSMVAEVEQNDKHPWHKLLGDLTSDTFKQANASPSM